jgi:Flp pilus assembly protein CpaB
MLATLFGILSAALMFAFLNSSGGSGTTATDPLADAGAVESVVVVKRDVGFGEEITSDMVSIEPVAVSALLLGAYTSIEDVVGKFATARLYPGEQIIAGKVTTTDEQSTLAFKVPEGMRGLSLMIPHEAWEAAGLVQPGDRVDVLGITVLTTVDPLTGEEKPEIVSGIIAQNVAVLAVSQTIVRVAPTSDVAPTDATASENGDVANFRPLEDAGTYEEAISVTLALTPEQSARVAIIDAMDDKDGQWRLLPRRQDDGEEVTGQVTWTLDDVFDRGN